MRAVQSKCPDCIIKGTNVLIRLQVGMKRGRSQIEQLDQDETGEPRKKLRLGTPTCQWITVYNAHAPMKQRYVTDT
jgi:hypothetical protein